MLSLLVVSGESKVRIWLILFAIIYIVNSLSTSSLLISSRSGSTNILSVVNDTTITVNGQKHAIIFRSAVPAIRVAAHDVPVLLILHGGPGASDIPFLHEADNLLEEHFIVVHYDQRSAGKSCRYYDSFGSRSSASLTIQQHVDDALEIIRYVKREFHQRKIYLVGGSWGSILTMILAKRYPELFHFVAAHGIVVDCLSSELIAREFILDQFPTADLPMPPYDDRIEDLNRERQWLNKAGGVFYKDPFEAITRYLPLLSQFSLGLYYAQHILLSSEFPWMDKFRFNYCSIETTKQMMKEVFQFNAYKELQGSLEVPILFVHGRHDQMCAMQLVDGFVKSIDAPYKQLIWFEKSGHFCDREESGLFQTTLIEAFLGDANSGGKSDCATYPGKGCSLEAGKTSEASWAELGKII